ncbi:MAG: hypothetical protein ACT4OO_05065 [Nitrospiraceae bacterium]
MTCERCGGLKIFDHFYGTEAEVSAWSYEGLRCLNCGNVSATTVTNGRLQLAAPPSPGRGSERKWPGWARVAKRTRRMTYAA